MCKYICTSGYDKLVHYKFFILSKPHNHLSDSDEMIFFHCSRTSFTSLKTIIPHNWEIKPGPAQIIGYETIYGKFVFAMNQETWAIPQTIPLTIPGNDASLKMNGLFLKQIEYIMK